MNNVVPILWNTIHPSIIIMQLCVDGHEVSNQWYEVVFLREQNSTVNSGGNRVIVLKNHEYD